MYRLGRLRQLQNFTIQLKSPVYHHLASQSVAEPTKVVKIGSDEKPKNVGRKTMHSNFTIQSKSPVYHHLASESVAEPQVVQQEKHETKLVKAYKKFEKPVKVVLYHRNGFQYTFLSGERKRLDKVAY